MPRTVYIAYNRHIFSERKGLIYEKNNYESSVSACSWSGGGNSCGADIRRNNYEWSGICQICSGTADSFLRSPDRDRVYRALYYRTGEKCVPHPWSGSPLCLYCFGSGSISVNGSRVYSDSPALGRLIGRRTEGTAGGSVSAGYSSDYAGDERTCIFRASGTGGGLDKSRADHRDSGRISEGCPCNCFQGYDSDSAGFHRGDILDPVL